MKTVELLAPAKDYASAVAAVEAGAHPISLGRRILRTETAGICILSVLMFHLED